MGQPVAHLQSDRGIQNGGGSKLPTELGLTVRCFVEPKNGQWQAFSLEFGLAAQADSMEDAKRSLDHMISSYVHDALVGEDREYAHELLSRRATWRVYYLYYIARIFSKIGSRSKHAYHDPLALEPKGCVA
jgi:hypothetical protein